MSKAGDELENPVTGERAVVRQGTEDTGGQRVVTDLYLRPGGRVVGARGYRGIYPYPGRA